MRTATVLPLLLAALLLPAPARGQAGRPRLTDQVGFDQHLGDPIPLDLTFRDERGRAVRLGESFGKRPVILTLVYFRCPMLCNQVLNALARSLKPLSPSIGTDYDVVTVSIDPEETPELAAAKKAAYLRRYDRAGAEAGWHFLTGEKPAIDALAKAVGFRFTYNPQTKQFVHAAGITLLTPRGKLARYFYGLEYPARDLQLGLAEASAGKVGSLTTRVLLLCYDYDAATGKYTLAIVRLIRVAGTATALGLAALVLTLLWRERRARAVAAREPAAVAG